MMRIGSGLSEIHLPNYRTPVVAYRNKLLIKPNQAVGRIDMTSRADHLQHLQQPAGFRFPDLYRFVAAGCCEYFPLRMEGDVVDGKQMGGILRGYGRWVELTIGARFPNFQPGVAAPAQQPCAILVPGE